MPAAQPVFVGTGAWIALALTRDPLHARGVIPATGTDVERAWPYFDQPDLHKLAAGSFVLMTERRIRTAFAFDSHFATAGFRMVG